MNSLPPLRGRFRERGRGVFQKILRVTRLEYTM
jgi:hypothetical protein